MKNPSKNDHYDHIWSFFLYNLYIFVYIQQSCLANMLFALDPGFKEAAV